MGDRHPNIINADELPWIDLAAAIRKESPGDAARGTSFGVLDKTIGQAAGGHKLGCSLYELPPGKRSFPFHYHAAREEAIYVLDGEATLRLGDREIPVRAGDYIALPIGPAHAHQMVNRSSAIVRYLCMSTMELPEVAVYPDSNKVGLMGARTPANTMLRQLHRVGESLSYFDGED
jgi:uncharacterized cupin superfamily protein